MEAVEVSVVGSGGGHGLYQRFPGMLLTHTILAIEKSENASGRMGEAAQWQVDWYLTGERCSLD